MSTRLSPDGRAVVEAVDRLTTQVKRLADAQSTPVAVIRDGVTTPVVGDPFPAGTCDASTLGLGNQHLGPCLLRPGHDGPVHRGPEGETWATVVATADDAPTPDFTSPLSAIEVRQPCPYCPPPAMIPRRLFAEHVAREHEQQAPASDGEQQRATRREQLHNLLARLDHGGLLSTPDCTRLRVLVDTEIREADQLRAGRATWKAKAEEIERERDQQYARAERAVRRAADEYDRRQDAERERDAEQARLRDLLRSESQRGNKAIDRETTAEQAAEEARAELEQAQAAITRVRKLASRWAVLRAYGSAATELRRALDGTEQPTGCPCHTINERCSGCGRCPDVCHGCDGAEQPTTEA